MPWITKLNEIAGALVGFATFGIISYRTGYLPTSHKKCAHHREEISKSLYTGNERFLLLEKSNKEHTRKLTRVEYSLLELLDDKQKQNVLRNMELFEKEST